MLGCSNPSCTHPGVSQTTASCGHHQPHGGCIGGDKAEVRRVFLVPPQLHQALHTKWFIKALWGGTEGAQQTGVTRIIQTQIGFCRSDGFHCALRRQRKITGHHQAARGTPFKKGPEISLHGRAETKGTLLRHSERKRALQREGRSCGDG